MKSLQELILIECNDTGHRTDLYQCVPNQSNRSDASLHSLEFTVCTCYVCTWDKSVCHLPSCRGERSRGVVKKMLLGVAVGTPLMVGVKYAVSEPRERRKMRILAEGVGRFCRSV